MKKALSIFLSAVIMLSAAVSGGLNAFAKATYTSFETVDEPYYEYGEYPEFETESVDAFNVKITRCFSENEEVLIPSEIDGRHVVEVGGFWSCNAKRVILPESVKTISNGAFSGCTKLESINLESVEKIGKSAFHAAFSLKEANLKSVKIIEERAFEYCKTLTGVTLGDGVKRIGEGAFTKSGVYTKAYKSNKKALYLNGCLIRAFVSKISGKYTVKAGTRLIADNAFEKTGSKKEKAPITSVYVPDSVKNIGSEAFLKDSINKIRLPKKLTGLGENAFSKRYLKKRAKLENGCYYLGKYLVSSKRYDLSVKIKKGTVLIADGALYAVLNKKLTIPSGVKYIGEAAISGCQRLTKVSIPASVVSIGDNNFVNYTGYLATSCKRLKTVSVNKDNDFYASVNGVLYSKDKTELIAYPNDKAGESFTVPSGVKIIRHHAFAFANNLKELKLNAGLETVGAYACGNCKLKSITIPESVSYVGRCAFGYDFFQDENTNGYFLIDGFKVYGKKGSAAETYCGDRVKALMLDDTWDYLMYPIA
ncbi:MAG: leucine-rich repeat domain-containing protein, partial [Eubacterium sp.]|nr:leucine-rich repeat domain-containing protein [Eubacterium sp.]